jgi:Tol biopolymer transport system component
LLGIAWSPTGQRLAYVRFQGTGSSVALLSLDAKGNPKVLYEMPAGAAWVSFIVPSPDGRRLAFTKRVYIDDVMLLENF